MIRSKTDLIVIHCTATNPNSRLTVQALRMMHKRRGFSDIGYNEWIDRAAVLQPGRGVFEVGAHVAGYNSVSYGISLEGGLYEFDATDAMMATLLRRSRQLVEIFPHAKFCGHRDLSPDLNGNGIIEPFEHMKECPRFDVIPWARENGLPAADIKGKWDAQRREPEYEHKYVGPDARIMWLQKLLRNLDYQIGPVDGIAGPRTRLAVEIFQEDYTLPRTGEFDSDTVAKLRELNNA